MIDSLKLLAWFVVSLFRSKGRLEAEIVVLRHQLNVLRRRSSDGGVDRSADHRCVSVD